MNAKQAFQKWWGKVVFRHAGHNPSTKSSKHSRIFYNTIGFLYDKIYTNYIYAYRNAADEVVNKYIKQGETVLDLGCGTGLLTTLTSKKDCKVIGLDYSIAMLRKAQKKHSRQDNVLYLNADCRNLPFNGPFDKIVSSFMLIILSKNVRQDVIGSLYPLLRENGEAIFLTSRDEFSSEWYSRDDWKEVAEKKGFTLAEIKDCYDFYRIVRLKKPNGKDIITKLTLNEMLP